jgi:hypothetical protein
VKHGDGPRSRRHRINSNPRLSAAVRIKSAFDSDREADAPAIQK